MKRKKIREKIFIVSHKKIHKSKGNDNFVVM